MEREDGESCLYQRYEAYFFLPLHYLYLSIGWRMVNFGVGRDSHTSRCFPLLSSNERMIYINI